MREITTLMDHYRILARSIWNNGFWREKELQTYDSWDRFTQIKRLLFNAVVVAQVSDVECCADLTTMPFPICEVVPLKELAPVPIMIQKPREDTGNIYWDEPIDKIKVSDATLHFIDYFDWNNMDYADFRYYRVRIAGFASHAHLVGREALIEHGHAKVFVL